MSLLSFGELFEIMLEIVYYAVKNRNKKPKRQTDIEVKENLEVN